MRFEIKRAKNGYMLQCDSEEDPFVFQELSEDIMDENDCWAYFLRELTSQYGPSTSRASKKRVYVKVLPGDKFNEYLIRHIVIVQFKKGMHENYLDLMEQTRPLLQAIPGLVSVDFFENESKYTPSENESIGVEILFDDRKALEEFMQNPKHFEANAVFEKYLASPPYMVLTHGLQY